MTFAFGGVALFLLYAREVLRNKILLLFTAAALFYTFGVFVQNYLVYIDLGVPLATNGRYLFPVLPIFGILVGLSLIKLVGRHAKRVLITAFLFCLLLMSQGGGIMIYLLDNFQPIYWRNNTALKINEKAKETLAPLVKGG
jgi:hypothetical protein